MSTMSSVPSFPFQTSSKLTSPSLVSMVLIRTVFLVCVSTVGSGSETKGKKTINRQGIALSRQFSPSLIKLKIQTGQDQNELKVGNLSCLSPREKQHQRLSSGCLFWTGSGILQQPINVLPTINWLWWGAEQREERDDNQNNIHAGTHTNSHI